MGVVVPETRQGWYPDPLHRHEYRYFSAGQPTALVRDGTAEGNDPPPQGELLVLDQVDADRVMDGWPGTTSTAAPPSGFTRREGGGTGLGRAVMELPRPVRLAVFVRAAIVAWLAISDLAVASAAGLTVAVLRIAILIILGRRIVYRPSRALRLIFQAVNLLDVAAFIALAVIPAHPRGLLEREAAPAIAASVLFVLLNRPASREYFDSSSMHWRGAYLVWAVMLVIPATVLVSAAHPSSSRQAPRVKATIDGTTYSISAIGDTHMTVRTTGAISTSCTTILLYGTERTFDGEGQDVCLFNRAAIGAFIVERSTTTAHVKLDDGTIATQIGVVNIGSVIARHHLLIVDTHGRTIVGVTFT